MNQLQARVRVLEEKLRDLEQENHRLTEKLAAGDSSADRWPLNLELDANIRPETAALRKEDERVRAETSLFNWGQIFECASWGVATANSVDGMFLVTNLALAKMHGYTREELGHLSLVDLCVPSVQDELGDRFCDSLHEPNEAFKSRHVRRDGSTFPVMVTLTPIRDGSGRELFLAINVLDMTERTRLEEQLMQAQKMESIGRLAGGIAHDFNNRLTAIIGFTELALLDLKPGSIVETRLRAVREAGEKAAQLTRQLLAFSRRQVLQFKRLDLGVLLRRMLGLLEPLLGEDIELMLDTPPELHPIQADPGQLEQVLMNLAVNARDALPEGGKITISVSNVELGEEQITRRRLDLQPGTYVLLEVTDDGIGMSEEVQEHIFEPFFTTKAIGLGTGLGLSTSFGIVKQHRGDLVTRSRPMEGATFSAYFPSTAGLDPVDVEKHAAPLPHGTETVLVVDDAPFVRELVANILQRLGYSVLEAEDPLVALEMLQQQESIDLLIADVVMPKLRGTVLAREFVKQHPDARVMLMSGYPDEHLALKDARAEGVVFLPKPIIPNRLARMVRVMLDNRKRGV